MVVHKLVRSIESVTTSIACESSGFRIATFIAEESASAAHGKH
jgi:hypothetical protein